jgi:hypothetical protein
MSICRKKDENVFCDFFVFSKTGPVQTPLPRRREGVGRNDCFACLQFTEHLKNGTPKTRAIPEMGPVNQPANSNNNPISLNKLSVAPIIVVKVPSVQLEL